MPHDGELLHDFATHGSNSAFAALVQRHVDFVYATALRQSDGDVHRAKDITQSVFTDLARKAATLSKRTTVAGWLHISASHAAAHLKRTEQRRQAREREAHARQALEGRAAPDWQIVRPVLDRAIGELNDADREAVLLRYFEQRTFADIAAALRIEEDTARRRVARALGKLHIFLTRRGITSTAAALATVLANHPAVSAPAGLGLAVSQAAVAANAAAGGSGALAALVNFMSTTKIVTATATVVALVAITTAFFQFCARRDAEVALAATVRERDEALRRAMQHLPSRAGNQTASRPIDAAAASDAAAIRGNNRPTAPAARSDSDASSAASPGTAAFDRFVAANPRLQSLYVRQGYLQTVAGNQQFYQTERLSPAQIAAVNGAIEKNMQTRIDIHSSAVAEGLDKNDPAAAKLIGEAHATLSTELRGILGDELYERYQQYQSSAPYRAVANTLATDLLFGRSPLTEHQANRLTRVVADSVSRGAGTADWEYLFAQAKFILSPAQLDALSIQKQRQELGPQIVTALKGAPAIAPESETNPERQDMTQRGGP